MGKQKGTKKRKHRFSAKRHANHLHAKRRMMQRFGISLNSTKHRELVSKIKAHNGAGVQNGIEFVKRLSNARTLWRIEYEGQIILVVYDKNNTSIITALYDTGEPELNNELERLP